MVFKAVEEAAALLLFVAKNKIPEEGWTLLVSYWDDDTFQLEYRHGNNEGIHRFMYNPHRSSVIKYYVYIAEDLMRSQEGSFEYSSKLLRAEILDLGKKCRSLCTV